MFPHGIIWGNAYQGRGYDTVLLGTVEPPHFDVDEWQAKLDQPEYAAMKNSLESRHIFHGRAFRETRGARLGVDSLYNGRTRSLKLDEKNEVEFYRPLAQRTSPFMWVVVKTNAKVEPTTRLVKSALSQIDSSIPIIQPNSMDDIVNQSLGQRRLTMALLGGFAAIALVLAMVGIYGAVAYTVEQRTGEIGVRMALGAQTRDVLALVVRQGMSPVVIGLVVGLAAALALGRLLTTQLYEVSATNPALPRRHGRRCSRSPDSAPALFPRAAPRW